MQKDLADRAAFDQMSGIEHGNPIADAADHVHLVRDQHDGQAQLAVDLVQQLQHRGGGVRVECAGGLIAQQDARPGCKRACHADTLFLATGKLGRVLARMILKADTFEQLQCAGAGLGLGQAGQAQRKGDVVQRGFGPEQVEVLKDHADAAAQGAQAVSIQPGQILPINDDAPAAWGFQPVDQAQQGAFSGPGVTDDAEHFAGVDFKIKRMQRGQGCACVRIGLWVRSKRITNGYFRVARAGSGRQQLVDQFDQGGLVDRLGQIRLGPLTDAPDAVGFLILGGDQHDRDMCGIGVLGD